MEISVDVIVRSDGQQLLHMLLPPGSPLPRIGEHLHLSVGEVEVTFRVEDVVWMIKGNVDASLTGVRVYVEPGSH